MEAASSQADTQAEIYDTDRFAELYSASLNPRMESLGLAARFLVSFFQTHGIAFAFLGGWAVYLRGGWRRTEDVDICVNTTMEHLTSLLLRGSRSVIIGLKKGSNKYIPPNGNSFCVPEIHGLTCIQVFVHTGGTWDPDFPGVPPISISVDIIINGYLGTPQGLPSGTEIITPVPFTTQGTSPVSAIDIFYQMSTKLQAHYTRRTNGGTNDYVDLVFLISSFTDTVWEMRHFLNLEHRRVFFEDFVANNLDDDTGDIRAVQMTLGL